MRPIVAPTGHEILQTDRKSWLIINERFLKARLIKQAVDLDALWGSINPHIN